MFYQCFHFAASIRKMSLKIFSLCLFFNIQEIYLVEHKLDIVALKGCNDSGSAPVPVNHIKKYVKYVRTIKSK